MAMPINQDNQTKKKIRHKIKRVRRKTVAKTNIAAEKAKTFAVGEEPKTETPDRVTSETMAKHRKEVLSTSKRFIYPLTHSKYKVAIISAALFLMAVLLVFGTTALMLYRYQRTDDFAYRISQIVPFPVARVDGDFVSYEDYLFEVRQNTHFYTTQDNINFDDEEGKAILANIKSEALQRVKEDAIARKLAKQNNITVSSEEVTVQIGLIREQGGIGESDEALENTLNEYYNWSLDDFESVIELQILKQKLISVLDADATNRIEAVQAELAGGAKFGDLAIERSEDLFSKDNGGKLGSISRSNTDFPPVFVDASFALEKDQVSEIVTTTVGLHIIKHGGVDTENEEQIKIAHILIQFKDIGELLRRELANIGVSDYIEIDGPGAPDGVIESRPQIDDQR